MNDFLSFPRGHFDATLASKHCFISVIRFWHVHKLNDNKMHSYISNGNRNAYSKFKDIMSECCSPHAVFRRVADQYVRLLTLRFIIVRNSSPISSTFMPRHFRSSANDASMVRQLSNSIYYIVRLVLADTGIKILTR